MMVTWRCWMMRPSMVFVLLFSTLFLLFVLAHAQKQEQSGLPAGPQSNESEISTKETDAAIKVEVNLVLVPVIVKDSSGEPVSGLKKEDFQLLDNGKPQTISTFSVETAETRASSSAVTPETKPAESEIEKNTTATPASVAGK